MIESPVLFLAFIGAVGVGSQWIAWWLRLPAIVLMLAAGVIAGPATGLIDPKTVLGDLYRPVVAVAVAVILFEGGITLNIRQLGGAGLALRRLVFVGAPLGWLTATLACHYLAGLSWQSAAVFGGILVVTGPTVTIPLLRQARLAPRPASLLRWEAIVNDPVGALFAVFAFEVAIVLNGAQTAGGATLHLALGVVVAAAVGYVAGRALVRAFRRGWAPEFMKAPILLASVLGVYAVTDLALHESGLLAVTVMGAVMGNARLPSLVELIRFKEQMTVLLVSGVFILLAASLEFSELGLLDWRAGVFVAAIVLLTRPIAVMVALIGSGLPLREKAIVAWVAPRGVVAVAVAGFFGAELAQIEVEDGGLLSPLAFVVVAATVVLHGFTMRPVARLLGLVSAEQPGVILVGASDFSVALAAALKKLDAPVLVADENWHALRAARKADLPVYRGEILSEAFEHGIDKNRYAHLIATTPNDAYNALVCSDFGPEFGRSNVHQIGRHESEEGDRHMPATIGGRGIAGGLNFESLEAKIAEGWKITATKLSDSYDLEAYLEARPEAILIAAVRGERKELALFEPEHDPTGEAGDRILALTPPGEQAKGKEEEEQEPS